jgi:hypothetical protein
MRGNGGLFFGLVFSILAVAGSPLVAEDYTFLPPEFYVGDEVVLAVTVPAEEGEPRLPRTIPDHRWIEIRDLSIEESGRGYGIRIRFVCFSPEEVAFPRIDFGSVVIENVPVTPTLLSGPETELTGIQSPLLLPGTRLLILSVAGGLILLPLGGIFLLPPLLAAAGSQFRSIRRRRSFLAARRALRKLGQDHGNVNPKTLYDEINRIFRTLFSTLYADDFGSLTARELRDWDEAKILPVGLVDLLIKAEHIRYGGVPAARDGGRSDIEAGLGFLEEIRAGGGGSV